MRNKEVLEKFLNPKSVAVIGVSKDFSSISGKPLKNLIRHHYKGAIYPVNPRYDEIGGITCYPSILNVPGEIDVALIAVSQARIMQIFEECKQKSVKHLILFGAGFAEAGEEGRILQEKLLEEAKRANMHLLGPNCIGLLNAKESIPLGFSTSFETDKGFVTGNVGFASQSGALGFSLFGIAQEENIGFSYIVNTGNQIDIHTLDCMEYMLEDEDTTVVCGYLESIPDGNMLINLAERSKQLKKPLVLLKAGRSELGKQAAMSHTASLTGSEQAFQAIAKQYGVITANDIDDMIDAMKIFSRGKLANGNRVVTISNSGAAGIAMADYSEELGLELVTLSKETEEKIKQVIPPYGSAMNPVDITAQALKEQHIFIDTLKIVIDDPGIDAIIVQTTFGGELGKKICEKIAEIDKTTDKPIIVTVTGSKEITGHGKAYLEEKGVPVYTTSYKTMVALKRLVEFSLACKDTEKNEIHHAITYQIEFPESGVWTEEKVKQILAEMNIRVPKGTVIKSKEQLEKVKDTLSFPVVCKVISDDILHKTDAGGVKVNIRNPQELQKSYEDLMNSVKKFSPTAKMTCVLVEEMIQEEGVEMFIGIKDDPDFGSLIVCGLGGVFIEILNDISIRKTPISINEAHQMLKELKGYALLEGVRGSVKRDIQALAEAIVQISNFAHTNEGKMKEMDINPIWVFQEGKGIAALDGMIVWKE
ncbi:acetate--CoA ligase family protein [Pueribacillus theae]|nr:acetate--CoA ligase family protein [Pueribacillus theae]